MLPLVPGRRVGVRACRAALRAAACRGAARASCSAWMAGQSTVLSSMARPLGVLGSLAGAFAGAVLGEYLRNERLEPSLRIGGHAFVGRIAAMAFKHVLALVMVGLILRATAP